MIDLFDFLTLRAKSDARKVEFIPYIAFTSGIKNVIFNDPATIILWNDGTKTVVKCKGDEIFDHEKGLAMAICKKMMGSLFHPIFKTFTPYPCGSISEWYDLGYDMGYRLCARLSERGR